VNRTVGLVLLATIVGLAGFDLFMMMKYGPNDTISWYVYSITKEWPILTLLVGIVLGHFFFPMKGIKE
jgi:L-lactate permease